MGVVVSLTSDPGQGADWSAAAEGARVAAYRAEGYRRFQLKVGGDPAEDIERIRAVSVWLHPGDRLVEVNLVYRRGDLGDRRRVLVFVSPRGRSLYRKLAGTVDREEAALMAGIRDDDAATLGDLLKRLADP